MERIIEEIYKQSTKVEEGVLDFKGDFSFHVRFLAHSVLSMLGFFFTHMDNEDSTLFARSRDLGLCYILCYGFFTRGREVILIASVPK
jgi:hypothetical protein